MFLDTYISGKIERKLWGRQNPLLAKPGQGGPLPLPLIASFSSVASPHYFVFITFPFSQADKKRGKIRTHTYKGELCKKRRKRAGS